MTQNQRSNADFFEQLQANLERRRSFESTINAYMPLQLLACDLENKTATFQYTVADWTANVSGTMHGGITSTLFDIALSAFIITYYENDNVPTVELQINFMKPIKIGSTLVIECRLTGWGRTIVHATAEAYREGSKVPRATANAVFYAIKSDR